MGFRDGAYATVWEVTEQGNGFSRVRLSTSRKNKETGKYTTDFSGFVNLVATAHKDIRKILDALSDYDYCRIKIGGCDVSNRYDKEKEREYTNFTIFSFEMSDSSSSSENSKEDSSKKPTRSNKKTGKASTSPLSDFDDEEDGDLPF